MNALSHLILIALCTIVLCLIFVVRLFLDCATFLIMSIAYSPYSTYLEDDFEDFLGSALACPTFFNSMRYCKENDEIFDIVEEIDRQHHLRHPEYTGQTLIQAFEYNFTQATLAFFNATGTDKLPEIYSAGFYDLVYHIPETFKSDFMVHTSNLSMTVFDDEIIELHFNNNFAHPKTFNLGFTAFFFLLRVFSTIGLNERPFSLTSYWNNQLRPFTIFRAIHLMERLCNYSTDKTKCPLTTVCTWPHAVLDFAEYKYATRRHLQTHLSHVISTYIGNTIFNFGPLLTPSGSVAYHPLLRVHHAFCAPRFFHNSMERIQLYCTILFFSDTLVSLSKFAEIDPPIVEHIATSGNTTWSTGMRLFNRLPVELQTHILEQDLIAPFSQCECHMYECTQHEHTSRCRRAVNSHCFRLPRLYPIRSVRYRQDHKPHDTLFGFDFIYTFEDNSVHGFPRHSSTFHDAIATRQYTVLHPKHGQFAFPPEPDMFQLSTCDFPTRKLRITSITPNCRQQLPWTCSSPDDTLVPMSIKNKGHTLVFD